jgi:hypothetical protein
MKSAVSSAMFGNIIRPQRLPLHRFKVWVIQLSFHRLTFYKLSYLQLRAKCYKVKTSKINFKTISVMKYFLISTVGKTMLNKLRLKQSNITIYTKPRRIMSLQLYIYIYIY